LEGGTVSRTVETRAQNLASGSELSPLAGKPARKEMLVDLARLDRRNQGHFRSGWFAARPSGTANIYKIYAESFRSQDHLNTVVSEAKDIVAHALEEI
jgi:phosphoglucomutase